jgi:ribose transport system permease protein
MYAVGGNAEVARLTGLKVERVKLTAFVISGFLAAVAGMMTVSRMGIGDPVVGDGFELDSITAVVLGGTSLFGGRGSVVGTLGGVLLLALVNNVLNLLGVTVWFQGLIKGLIILLAVAVYKQKS